MRAGAPQPIIVALPDPPKEPPMLAILTIAAAGTLIPPLILWAADLRPSAS